MAATIVIMVDDDQFCLSILLMNDGSFRRSAMLWGIFQREKYTLMR